MLAWRKLQPPVDRIRDQPLPDPDRVFVIRSLCARFIRRFHPLHCIRRIAAHCIGSKPRSSASLRPTHVYPNTCEAKGWRRLSLLLLPYPDKVRAPPFVNSRTCNQSCTHRRSRNMRKPAHALRWLFTSNRHKSPRAIPRTRSLLQLPVSRSIASQNPRTSPNGSIPTPALSTTASTNDDMRLHARAPLRFGCPLCRQPSHGLAIRSTRPQPTSADRTCTRFLHQPTQIKTRIRCLSLLALPLVRDIACFFSVSTDSR